MILAIRLWWATNTPGVTDTEALRMAGNGVVRQQAVAALRLMLNRMEDPRGRNPKPLPLSETRPAMTEHTCTQHPEPAETCYCQHQCRCDGCRRERLRAQKRRKHQGGATVPAGPTRTHLAQLLAGSTLTEVAKATGLSPRTLLRIREGDVTRVNRTTERAILTTRIDTPTVSIIGTRRRLDALRAIGWTLKEISEHAGHDHGWACTVYKRARILPATHAQVCAVYDALWNVTPPAETWSDRVSRGRARRAAAQAGWAPPLAWDDDEIDNPDAQPHHHVRGAGHARLIENVEWLADADEKLPAIAARLGQPERSLKRQLLRAGRADLIRRGRDELGRWTK